MENTAIIERLTYLLRDMLDDDGICLTDETAACDVPGWDSLVNVRFILATEQAFKIRFAAAESARLKNVGELVALIRSRA